MKTIIQKSSFALLFGTVLLLAYPSTARASSCVATEDDTGVAAQTLFAGQHIDSGDVFVEIVDDHLIVTYSTIDEWSLGETHLWVGTALSDMPQTKKGNPKIGLFPYSSGDISGSTSYSFSIPLTNIGFSCPGEDQNIFIAAHAVVSRPDGNGGYQTETGWGAGDRFVDKGSWATYFNSTLTCDCGNPPPPPSTCETAFAYSADQSTCFLDLDLDEDGTRDFSRWGWTSGPIGEGEYTFDVYAGAGKCDLSKGTLVGELIVDYFEGSLSVEYSASGGYGFEETHLYVGSSELAKDVNGEFTVAPGQYPFIHENLGETASDTFSVSGLSGDIYIVAHAVSCGAY